MDIKTFADLAKLANICRKSGIKQIKITSDGIEFMLGDKPGVKTRGKADEAQADPKALTEEEMLYWSSAGVTGAQQ